MRIVVPVAILALGFTMVSSPVDATGRWRRDLNWHRHGHVQGHHHHYFDNRTYTYNYRPYIPGPNAYYRPYYNRHLTMQYSQPYGQPPAYGAAPAYGRVPAYGNAPSYGYAPAQVGVPYNGSNTPMK